MPMTFPSDEKWTLNLWSADFVVLYDWLMSLDFSQLPVSHKAEKQALTDLLDFRSFEASGLPLTLGRLSGSGTAGLG
jgi:hypothetical protein